MAAKKTKVVFIKRVEDRDKNGEKIVTPAGTKAELTEAEYKRVQHAVRVIKDEADEKQRPVLASGSAPDATGSAGDGEDDDTGDGATGG
ncbi:hypothetical protein [Marinobacter nauticus]|uniref:Uncharacterized protein n=1 Tax=Marinobacter nauticus TaxID=2743 RepID=A0A368V583_MARNT|nr:hypothetical protein [Marinobacter nauticus]RBP74105.1 hypothetical protein DET64_105231 [Marinobacter nauticus]RCW34854.1 hypothetical protein DET51_105230 [Marinobacter nauticus]